MAKQIIFATPSADWCAVDNSSAPTFPTLSNATSIGYDTTAPGATSQSTNPFADTGSVLVDASGNDTVYADPSCATVAGNPTQNKQPTFATVTKVLTNPLSATVTFKNPC
jgi:hypothetical protein